MSIKNEATSLATFISGGACEAEDEFVGLGTAEPGVGSRAKGGGRKGGRRFGEVGSEALTGKEGGTGRIAGDRVG